MKGEMRLDKNEHQEEITSPKHVYIHIPFCAQKCFYCDFAVFVWQGEDWVDQYLGALEHEISRVLDHQPLPRVETIYIGGGTPSLLNESQLERLFSLLARYFPIRTPNHEISLETNPGTLTPSKLEIIKAGGVNRISIGVQTFHDAILKRIGRNHTAKEAIHAVYMVEKAGFNNINIDLMYGLPGQEMDHLLSDLDQVSQLPLTHLSAYNLKVEENTHFGRWQREGSLLLPGEELEAEMYERIIEKLSSIGLEQYELSNFARPGFRSQHNLGYWLNHRFYGFGAGAWGYLGRERYGNMRALIPYIRHSIKGLPREEILPVTEQEEMEEMMFLGLRLTEGISDSRFRERWNVSMNQIYGVQIEELTNKGLLEKKEDRIRLTPMGRFLSNEVFVAFLQEK